jgi:flagellar biosynthetic protein FlhB
MASGGDKTEKATPKKREEARKKGSVAKSQDLNGAIVMFAALFALSATAPHLVEVLQTSMRDAFGLISTPDIVNHRGLGPLMSSQVHAAAVAAAPVIFTCVAAAVLVNVAQVGGKPHITALKPDPKRLNPLSGFKNIYGPNALFEGAKNIVKVVAVGAVTALAVLPKLDELASLVGLPPGELLATLAHTVLGIAQRAGAAYLLIGLVDYAYQKYRHEKNLKMDKQEVKDEHKSNEVPAEVRGAMRRRQMQAARARMMDDVPTADVVVTNPTHFAVALKYDPEKAAPEVVAKGADLIAKKIRELAADSGVPVIADPPLARSLHASVEIGHVIPEELYQAVAGLLAFVYRTARRRALA